MKSRTSFFNGGLCRNLLRRCWPVWAAYLAALVAVLPVSLFNRLRMADDGARIYLDMYLLNSAKYSLYLSFVFGLLSVMAMFSFLYSTRGCGMINALPLKRETVFCTAWLTGLVPMLLCDALVLGFTALTLGRAFLPHNLWVWLATALGGNLAFYGIASFCAMLTGSLVILPALYVVLNLTATVVESCLVNLLEKLVYGFAAGNSRLLWLSPIAKIHVDMHAGKAAQQSPFRLSSWEAVPIYAAAGLVLSILALLLYRRRAMETATDTVAIPVLKPIFRYCMAFGTALVLASGVYSVLLGGGFDGRAAALLILALLILGAFLGYYAAEMLIQKTLRVFFSKWKGFAAVCLVLVAFVGAAELDLTGYERRIPEAGEVEWASLRDGVKLRQPESLEKVVALHQSLLEHKRQHEGDVHNMGTHVTLDYQLKDGRHLHRHYYLSGVYGGETEDYTDVRMVRELLNLPEALDQDYRLRLPLDAEHLFSVVLYTDWYDENLTHNRAMTAELTPEQGETFIRDCVLPDLAEHKLGREWLVFDEDYSNTVMNLSIQVELRQSSDMPNEPFRYEWFSVQLTTDAERSLQWIRENTALTPVTLRDAGAGNTP